MVLTDGEAPRRATAWDAEETRPTWFPDGRHIAFTTSRDGWTGLWAVDLAGGDPELLTPPGLAVSAPEISPDGERVVYQSDLAGSMDLWIVELANGEVRRLTDHPDNEWHPRWSPDGERVVFYTTWDGGMTDVWVVEAAGGVPHQLTDHPAEDWRPTFSRDGSTVAFASGRSGTIEIWTVSTTGGEPERLTDDAVAQDYIDYSPDGRRLLARTDASATYLFRAPLDGRPTTRWPGEEIEAGEASGARVSPRRAEVGYLAADPAGHRLVVRPLDGRPGATLELGDAVLGNPAWSPDGERLAFTQNLGGGPSTSELWTARRDGSEHRRVVEGGGVRDVVWCGDALVFSRDPGVTYRHDVWRVDADGSHLQALVRDGSDYRVTDCTRDGATVLLTRFGVEGAELLALDPASGASRPLLPHADRAVHAEGARMSPDGSRIAYLSNAEGPFELYVAPLAGGNPQRVTHGEERESWPDWANDAELLYSVPIGGVDLWEFPVPR